MPSQMIKSKTGPSKKMSEIFLAHFKKLVDSQVRFCNSVLVSENNTNKEN
jgi:hypothetical protein